MEVKKMIREEFDRLEDKARNFYEVFEGNKGMNYLKG